MMAEAVVRRAVEAFLGRDLDGILALADENIVLRSLLTEAERPLYVLPDWRPQPRAASYDEDGRVVLCLDVTATGAAIT